jgi:hypothetical protein
MANRQATFITDARTQAKKLLDAILALESMQTEWNALDYLNTLTEGSVGDNEGYTAAEVGAVVFDTANAFRGLLNTGHATNLARLLTWLVVCGSVVGSLNSFGLITFAA